MECQMSNRLRELILRCSALKNPLNHKILCPIMVPYWILDINFIRFKRKGCNHKNCLLGQLISKTNCQAEDSPKKRMNEFVFTSMRRVFVRFLEEFSARKKRFEII